MILILLSMSERLQVILESKEYSIVRKAATRDGKNISDWVRGLIRDRLQRQQDLMDPAEALKMLRQLSLPAPPIEQMLREIEEGRA